MSAPWYNPLQLDHVGLVVASCELGEGDYTPPFDLAGKTVLDVGATCGEVAYWYIKKYHAEKVVCVENDPAGLIYLRKNKALMNIEIVEESFCVRHLEKFKCDFIKCDAEGQEMILLEYVAGGGVLPPTVVEAHTNWIRDQFLKAGFKVKRCTNQTCTQVACYVMTNYNQLGV